MHVAAVGSRSEAAESSTLPAIWMHSWGSRYLNPSKGGRGHEVAKRRSAALWVSLKLSTAYIHTQGGQRKRNPHNSAMMQIGERLGLLHSIHCVTAWARLPVKSMNTSKQHFLGNSPQKSDTLTPLGYDLNPKT